MRKIILSLHTTLDGFVAGPDGEMDWIKLDDEINRLRHQAGKNILIFGSPTAAHSLMEHNLIDEYWLFVNPILLGRGIPVFARIKEKVSLKPLMIKAFPCGVTALHYILDK